MQTHPSWTVKDMWDKQDNKANPYEGQDEGTRGRAVWTDVTGRGSAVLI